MANLSKYTEELFKEPNVDEVVENDLRIFLASKYSEYGTINTQNNDEKSKYLHRTNVAISISLIVLLLSLFPFYMINHSTS